MKGKLYMAKKVTPKTGGKARSKSEVYGELASASDLTRKQVACLFDDLASLIKADLGRKGPGIFTVPGLMKIRWCASRRPGPARASTPSPRNR